MGQFIGIIVAIVLINLIGGLLQAAAKKREQQKKLEAASAASQRRPGSERPRIESGPAIQAETRRTGLSAEQLASERIRMGADPRAGRRDADQFNAAPIQRTQVDPREASSGASAAAIELEKRRRAQLEELRRRRLGVVAGTIQASQSASAAPPPPPPTGRGADAVTAERLRRDAIRRADRQRASELAERAQEPSRPRRTPLAPPRGAPERRDAPAARLAPTGRSAADNPIRAMRGSVLLGEDFSYAVQGPKIHPLAKLISGPDGIRRLREAIVLREILDSPLGLRRPESDSGR